MIRIEVVRRVSGSIEELKVLGHADFDNEDGGDIVCAAVSALVGYLGITLCEQFMAEDSVQADSGFFRFVRPELSEELEKSLDIVLSGMLAALRQLEENYSGWVKVVENS